jgi:hypothetical protein
MTTREGRRVQADRRVSAGGVTTACDHAGDGPGGQMAGLARRFPPRALEGNWPATGRRPAGGAATCWRGCPRRRSPPTGMTCSPAGGSA